MTYVMSDIHGMYDKYAAMLEKINFSQDDTMFVLGDIVDRGEEPVKILKDMMQRHNIWPIYGNHDYCAYTVLKKLIAEIKEETIDNYLGAEDIELIADWYHDGGNTTVNGFYNLPHDERRHILEYLEEFSMYEIIDVGDKTFILVHAGLGNFSMSKSFDEYTIGELLCWRTAPDEMFFEDKSVYVVMGHTPTIMISGEPEILKIKNNIFIDCGAVYGGRLGCLCLDNMEEFYT